MRVPLVCQFTTFSEGSSTGWSSDRHEIRYGAHAAGGVGAVIVETAVVCPEGRISPLCLMLGRDEKIPGFVWLTTPVKEGGASIGAQISHTECKTSSPSSGTPLVLADDGTGGTGWHPVAPSPIPFSSHHEVPREPDLPGVKAIQNQFVQTARCALEAGFDFTELYGACGYLMHEFLSPIINYRIDEYDGDLKGRFRFQEEIIVMIRVELDNSFPLLVQISATSWLPESNLELHCDVTLDNWGKPAHGLSRLGMDFIDVSTGGLAPGAQIPVVPGYQMPYAQETQDRGSPLVSTVELITEPAQTEQILATGAASVVGVGKPLLTGPSLLLTWAVRLGDKPPMPEFYTRGMPRT